MKKPVLERKMKGQGKWRRDVSGHILWVKQTFIKVLSTALRQNQNLVAPIYYLKYPTFNKKFRDMQRNKKG